MQNIERNKIYGTVCGKYNVILCTAGIYLNKASPISGLIQLLKASSYNSNTNKRQDYDKVNIIIIVLSDTFVEKLHADKASLNNAKFFFTIFFYLYKSYNST